MESIGGRHIGLEARKKRGRLQRTTIGSKSHSEIRHEPVKWNGGEGWCIFAQPPGESQGTETTIFHSTAIFRCDRFLRRASVREAGCGAAC